jgi:hypothetical protein
MINDCINLCTSKHVSLKSSGEETPFYCSYHGQEETTSLWRWNRQSVPKRRHIKFRRRRIPPPPQKKKKHTTNFGNVANVRNAQNRSCPVKNNLLYSKHSRKLITGRQVHCLPYDEDVLLRLLLFVKQRNPVSVSGLYCKPHYLSQYKAKIYRDINWDPSCTQQHGSLEKH